MDLQLRDKVVLISGASAGIGLAAAKMFAAEGARVAIAARDHSRLEAAGRELTELGGHGVLAVAGDFAIYEARAASELLKLKDDLSTTQTSALDYAPNGALLATGDHQGRVRLWNAHSGEEIELGRGHRQGGPRSPADLAQEDSPRGRLLVDLVHLDESGCDSRCAASCGSS